MKPQVNNKKIIPYKISEGRKARALSMVQLSEKIFVSPQAISQYELGRKSPSEETFRLLCKSLRLPESFFCTETVENERRIKTISSYRASSTARTKYKSSAEQRMFWAFDIYLYLSDFLDFPSVNIPSELMLEKEFYTSEEITQISKQLRHHWQLGEDPIDNLISVLHLAGIVVVYQKMNDTSIESFSRWIGDTPIIVLNKDCSNPCRIRFTLAHELAHLILHSYQEDKDNPISRPRRSEMEKEAHAFASCFLMPEESFVDDIYSVSPDALLHIKPKWKVSVQSMIVRCHDLELINDNQYTYAFKIINKKGWRKSEPGDDILQKETPYMLKQAIQLILDNDVMNKTALTKALNLYYDEIEEICNLPDGLLKPDVTQKKLKLTLVR